ncbi:MAG: helix-turn-helix domain-containing protein [Alphaproteobacteria bacterium]|nr:helix-turn-helix domain-containing protein [Alphaproteobacteria bacterium]
MASIKREKHPLNIKIGERIRSGRKASGLSQSELGNAIPNPITFQQIQKYESGSNRISISMLCEIAEALQLPLPYFLEDLQDVKTMLSEVEWKILHSVRGLSGESQQALVTLLNEKTAE